MKELTQQEASMVSGAGPLHDFAKFRVDSLEVAVWGYDALSSALDSKAIKSVAGLVPGIGAGLSQLADVAPHQFATLSKFSRFRKAAWQLIDKHAPKDW